jgi:Putative zinc-finger
MTCADFEVLLCDYIDGTLDIERRLAVEEHQRECVSCAQFAEDVAGALAFVERAAIVEPPPELLTKITFDIPSTGGAKKGWKSWFGGWLEPVLQPRFAMGMAMTILSFSMLGRLIGVDVQQIKPSDLHPAKVIAAVDDKLHRGWARAVKYYDNLRLVYEVQTRLHEWSEQQEQQEDKGKKEQ